jgi:glycosyltransferase involved in cell wall biosynthesis
MNIVMVTNTYSPHVGGVARSVAAFSAEYRRLDHRVLIVAPEFAGMPENETDVVRIPSIQNFNGSDFSVVLPVTGLLTESLDAFKPEIVHAHHPYLLGMTALRIARYRELPLVFTHHTLYEQYTHYVPGDSPTLQRFVIELATHYANLTDQVFAPSESIASLIKERGHSWSGMWDGWRRRKTWAFFPKPWPCFSKRTAVRIS